MTSLFKPIKLILEFYYMSNGLTFEIFNIILQIFIIMRSLFKPIQLILEFYYMSNGLTFEIMNIILRNFQG